MATHPQGARPPRLGAPGDVPIRTGDTAPPGPIAPVSAVAPASAVSPASTVAMAPIAPVAAMASILLPQSLGDEGRRWCGVRDTYTHANGAEPQCANHRSPGRNLLHEHCQTPFANPQRLATLGWLNSCPRSTTRCDPRTKPCTAHQSCPTGHPDLNQVLVGHVDCLGHGGEDTPIGIAAPAWASGCPDFDDAKLAAQRPDSIHPLRGSGMSASAGTSQGCTGHPCVASG